MIFDDLYATLELPHGTDIKQVKKQISKLSQKYHPDKNPQCQDCESKMNKITRAYDILSNPNSKKEYDSSSKVLVTLKSKAIPLNQTNFEDRVLRMGAPWLIMVYDSNSQQIDGLGGFWDEFI